MYQQYLRDENSAEFIRSVSSFYNLSAIKRLAVGGQRTTRRGAILALGFLGDFYDNEAMGQALKDSDRAVRMLADHGIRNIWQRQGTNAQQSALKRLYRLVSEDYLTEAILFASRIIDSNPTISEAWSQRAIAYCAEGDYYSALEDCRETMMLNRFHFPAALGMAHCCIQLDDTSGALQSFRLALQINPDLEGVRNQIVHLERSLGN
jgi:tetratricopeptide (TPR) repeat protein